jgi:hypothetical protein
VLEVFFQLEVSLVENRLKQGIPVLITLGSDDLGVLISLLHLENFPVGECTKDQWLLNRFHHVKCLEVQIFFEYLDAFLTFDKCKVNIQICSINV